MPMTNYFQAATKAYTWREPQNVASPIHYTDDFSVDRGYFNEDNGAKTWRVESGTFNCEARDGTAITYLHVYEKNVTVKLTMRFSEMLGPDAAFGIMLRCNSPYAFVRFGCNLNLKAWFIDYCEGADFVAMRLFRTNIGFDLDRWYDVEFTVDGERAKLTVDGEVFTETCGVGHLSPGRIALFANNIAVSVKDFDAALLSGQGTLLRNVRHTKLESDKYMEGGTVVEMTDGRLIYEHKSGVTYESSDNGVSWSPTERFTQTYGYPNILRLRNGQLLKITNHKVNGVGTIDCATSDDDGKTWVDRGVIAKSPYRGIVHDDPTVPTAYPGNMNDKLSQTSTGRIFYSLNYECRPRYMGMPRSVFCEFYYSDDNGDTWTKSETDSFDLGGENANNVDWFAECKILECDDGSLRIYNSSNGENCVVYSESFDGGKTWGELKRIPELVCARSSMQFVKDVYADNETTYYMVWVYSPMWEEHSSMTRSRLSLAKSTDGKNWQFLGDVWRWEHP